MATPKKLQRIRDLIALAGSPEREEARNAAEKACALMREEHIDVREVIAQLPAAPGWTPPPPAAAPPPMPHAWRTPLLGEGDLEEQNRLLQAMNHMREAQLAATNRKLEAARREKHEQELREARLREALAERERTLQHIRANAPKPKKISVLTMLGAGRREIW